MTTVELVDGGEHAPYMLVHIPPQGMTDDAIRDVAGGKWVDIYAADEGPLGPPTGWKLRPCGLYRWIPDPSGDFRWLQPWDIPGPGAFWAVEAHPAWEG